MYNRALSFLNTILSISVLLTSAIFFELNVILVPLDVENELQLIVDFVASNRKLNKFLSAFVSIQKENSNGGWSIP